MSCDILVSSVGKAISLYESLCRSTLDLLLQELDYESFCCHVKALKFIRYLLLVVISVSSCIFGGITLPKSEHPRLMLKLRLLGLNNVIVITLLFWLILHIPVQHFLLHLPELELGVLFCPQWIWSAPRTKHLQIWTPSLSP